jgi:glycosyltransferase involved in cell wall biosynthesis
MKTVLIITDNEPAQVNGVVTTFHNLEILAERDGYDFVYLDPRQFVNIPCPGYGEIKLSWTWGIGKIIERVNPDYIHIATEGPVGFAARCWMDYWGWRYNTSYHTRFPEAIKKIIGIPTDWSYRYLRWFHKHSGRVLTTTQSMVDDLASRGFRTDIKPWTRGVDRNTFGSGSRTATELSQPILLSVGRVSKEKNLDVFCRLEYPGATKIVVGDGPCRRRMEREYPEVQFVGVKRGAELAKYYADADVFVFPSRWDTFGIVMIEAMACGTPVAAYSVVGPKDVIDQGITGYMDEDLKTAIDQCLRLDRVRVEEASLRWSWEECWRIFRDNLVDKC